MDVPRPFLSVVTPCLNRAAHLPNTLESVASLDAVAGRGSVEHIIVDGGSTDGSVEIIRRHAESHPALVTRWVSEPDRGQSHAINKGLSWARGTYATWLNADDFYEDIALAAALDRLRADPSIDVLIGRAEFFDESYRTIFEACPAGPVTTASLLRLRSIWFNGGCIVQPAAFFRLSRFREAGGLNEDNHYSMDFELWLKLAARSARFEVTPRTFAFVGVHPGQKTADNRSLVRSMLAVAARVPPPDADTQPARAELDSMARKLAAADALIERWDASRHPPANPAPPPETPPALLDAWRRLRTPRRVIAMAGLRLFFGGRGRILVDAHPGLGTADRLRARFRKALVEPAVDDLSPAPGADDGPPYDAIVTHLSLFTAPDPAERLARLWRRLRPGGLYVQLPEPRPVPQLDAYLAALTLRLSRQLSASDDVILDPGADAFLAGAPSPHACAGARGVDIPAIMARIQPGIVALPGAAFGAFDFHPLTPFPTVRAIAPRADAWYASLWRKPKPFHAAVLARMAKIRDQIRTNARGSPSD